MKRLSLCLLFILAFQFCSYTQNWQSVGNNKFNHEVDQIFSDTATGELYCTGMYWMNDTIPTYGISKWNGAEWDSAFMNIGTAAAQKRLARFQGQYYLAKSPNVYRWNGVAWDTVARTNNGGVYCLYNDGDSILYAVGVFSSVNSIQASNIAKFDGITWNPLDGTVWSGGGAACVYRYQNDLYFGGGFYNTTNNIWRIGRWDGTSWHQVGNGITGSLGAAFCMEEYNGELYVGGYMETALGNPGNYIASWNGTNWSQVGGGVWNGQVFNMKTFNNDLWVVGQFNSAGGIPATFVARYDGLDWCSVGTFDNAIGSIEVHNGELYIGGNFWTVDGDSVNKVVKWIGGNFAVACGHLSTDINEQSQTDIDVQVIPNPVTHKAIFQFSAETDRTIVVFDSFGREIWRKESREDQIEFLTAGFSKGIYFYQVQEVGRNVTNGKFIIQ